MLYEFAIDYAADKDTMTTTAGTAHVVVLGDGDSFTDARLTAESMIAAVGLEVLDTVEVAT